jgi:hypothetical protein
MRTAVQIVLPVVALRAAVLWGLIRLVFAVLPLAGGATFGAISSSPIAMVLLTGVVGLIDVHVRGERILWANLGVTPEVLCAVYAAVGVSAEVLLSLIIR